VVYIIYTTEKEKANGNRNFKFFSEDEIEKIAKETGLVKRKSPISGFKFLLTFTSGMLNTNDSTLTQMAAFLTNTCNAEVSPQAVDQKIKDTGKEFLKICLAKALEISMKRLNIDNEVLAHLTHVYIIDSTNFDLHPKLSEIFKGNSGAASKSSLRIQFVYDFLSGRMYIQIGDVKLTDAKTFHTIIKEARLEIQGAALFLADLGYYKTDSFLLIDKSSHFFISKFKFDVNIYDEQNNKLSIRKLFKKYSEIDIRVKIGNLDCRLVGKRLPDNVVNEKLRRANKEATRKGRTISEKYKIFLKFGLFITNLQESFTFDTLFNLYRLRWQIELIFKTWKSILGIHKIRSARENRVLCEIYGKLIIVALSNIIYWRIKMECSAVLSYHKILQYIKVLAINWTTSILTGSRQHSEFLKNLKQQIVRFCKKNKQKNKPHIELILEYMEIVENKQLTP